MNTIVEKFYKDHQVKPFISPERDLDTWFLNPKPVSKRNMELLADDLLAGDIILLWRIQFGTFTTETWF
jgi:DNA polymerase III, delta subunit